MKLAIVHTRASIGVQAPAVTVEVHISNGLPSFTLVGLPETTVKEARDRVRSALVSNGFTFPVKRITVSLAPADLPKEGGRFDLPIAIGILAASEQISIAKLATHEFLGELALSGSLRPIKGAIPAALAASTQQRTLILSQENGAEISLLKDNTHRLADHLLAVCHYLNNNKELPIESHPKKEGVVDYLIDIKDIIGQEQAKRALEITAAGGHNLLLFGPPGTGKTMLASRLITLLPPLEGHEALENATINGLINTNHKLDKNWHLRPFRSPHHSASLAALIGGGSIPKPGEISLAHNGVLFLDELPEFERRALDALREPLESGEITISRANAKTCFPARFQLIAAMNPSPMGHYQGLHRHRSHPKQIIRYLSRLSGPFLDRFDLSIEVPLLPQGSLSKQKTTGESSAQIKQRVITTRQHQLQRSGKLNAYLTNQEIEKFCKLTKKDAEFLEKTLTKLGLSIRAWHKILKASRTIADLKQEKNIQRKHIAEALSYRYMDRFLLRLYKNLE